MMSSSSIGVRINLMINFFLKFYGLKRENDNPITEFNWRFQSFYVNIPIEIRHLERLAMLYYTLGHQHPELVLHLRERKSSSLPQIFSNSKEVEDNL